MATKKEYAYYKQGNKFALIQKNITSANNAITDDTYGRYKSPVESVTDGIQLDYVYSPQYRVYSNITTNINKFYVLGWTVVDGYLTFLRMGYGAASIFNWTNGSEVAVTSGSSGDTGGQSLDYILVRGSNRWNGLHKVKSAGTTGRLQTWTKVSSQLPYYQDLDVDWNDDWTIYDGGGSDNVYLADHFSVGDYVWTTGPSSFPLWGLFRVSSITQSATDTSSTVTFDERYVIPESDNATTSSTGLDQVYTHTLVAGAGSTSSGEADFHIYKAFYDHCYVLTDVDVLNDENDTIDLSPYLSKALVYYIKARLMEDQLDIKGKEYFMREFRRMVEKHSSATSLTGGTYRIQGHGMTK